jgi:glycosyltransferase involved in cell wall biosynthesis
MSWAKLAGKKTVIDLDDAPSRTNNSVTLKNVEYMLRNVSVVTVGSRALFDYATGYSDNVYLIPSCVRLKYYRSLENRENAKDFICLGWIGNGKHYKEDLISILREPLAEVAKKSPIRLKLIGVCGEKDLYAAFSGIPGLHLDFIDQIDWSDPGAVSGALQDVDIVLYPLLQNEFNKYKCGFKALEYMAMGVPVVSSDVAENREIVIEGENGFFAYGSDEWRDALGQLVADASLRRRFGVNGRKLVEERYSVRVAAGLFLRAVDGDDL